MKSTSLNDWVLTIIIFLCILHTCQSFKGFQCKKDAGAKGAPKLPEEYSANIRLNFLAKQYTVEMIYATKDGKELIELKSKSRHVKYITRHDENAVLFIQYKDDEYPTCEVKNTVHRTDFLLEEDAGDNHIVLKALQVMFFPDMFELYKVEEPTDNGVFSTRYEGCLAEPKINITLYFADSKWTPTHVSYIVENVVYPEMAIAEIAGSSMTALYSYFDPRQPSDSMFDPPADTYCKGFRANKKPPVISDYFSYNAEIIEYESQLGVSPTVSQRKVYYDYPAKISRVDFTEAKSEGTDMFSPVTSQKRSIIHDFNSGVQYIFNSYTGKCDIDTFSKTFNAISFEDTVDNKILKGNEYFWFNDEETSYNGQVPIRGVTADVFTAKRNDPQTKKDFIVSWYFSTEETRITENDNVEKNVLLRMFIHPENDTELTDVEVQFYDFNKEEPTVYSYDLTSCFNDSTSKTLVFTFPGIDELKGSEKLIGMLIHLAIKKVTGMLKQRIYMREIIFSGGYMYAEFTLLEGAPLKGKVSEKEILLDDALKILKDEISKGTFIVKVPADKGTTYNLKPEPNGLNIFAGDRVRRVQKEGYKEGSVISLTIGMLILGFLLGGITLNLIISKKYGVSLFQKSKFKNTGFDNPLNESNM